MRGRIFATGLLLLSAGLAAHGAPTRALPANQLLAGVPLWFEGSEKAPQYTTRVGGADITLGQKGWTIRKTGGKEVRVSFLGSRPAELRGEQRLTGVSSYFVGGAQTWRSAVPHYRQVRAAGVYRGTDVVYYGNGRQLEYDFVLHPGAQANRVRLQVSGADQLRLNAQGDLELLLGDAAIVMKKPALYQEENGKRREIAGAYRIKAGNTVEFTVGAYDATRDLVIDPVVSYSSLVGGSGTDAVMAIVADRNGTLWVAGSTTSKDMTITDGALQSASGGSRDVFLAHLDPARSGGDALLSMTYLGGSDNEDLHGLAQDANGFLYLTGSTTSTNFPTSGYTAQSAAGGAGDAFVVKIDPSLSGSDQLAYSSYLGGTGIDIAYDLAVDAAGVIYLTGVTYSSDFPISGAPLQGSSAGAQEAFVAKIDPAQTQSLVYSTYLGADQEDEGRGILLEGSGVVTVVGTTTSGFFPTTGRAYQGAYRGGADVFVVQIDTTKADGGLLYGTFLGGSNRDEVRKVIHDQSGRLILTGFTLSTDFPTTSTAAGPVAGGNGDAFLVRLDPRQTGAAALSYGTYLGGADAEVGYGLALEADGSVDVAGYTLSSNFPVSNDAAQRVYSGTIDGFVVRLNLTQGSLTYGTYVGGSSVDAVYALAVTSTGILCAGGQSSSVNYTVTGGAWQTGYSGGGADGFLALFRP